jgi:uncharacterized protein
MNIFLGKSFCLKIFSRKFLKETLLRFGGGIRVNHSAVRVGLVIGVLSLIFLLGFTGRDILTGWMGASLPSEGEWVSMNKLVAVDAQGQGVSARLITSVKPGAGLVLVNINNVLADITTQQSARDAVTAASKLAHVDPNTVDVVFTIDTSAELVSGRSAGSVMAIAVAGALLNTTLRNDVVMTGDINEQGTIGMVQAIPMKAQAAKALNASVFLVPVGGGSHVVKFEREKACGEYKGGEYCTLSYVAHESNLGEDIGLDVVEVATLADAAKYYFGYGEI